MNRRFQVTAVLTLFALVLLLFSILGHSEPEGLRSFSVIGLFEPKGKGMKEVATEIAQLPEQEPFNVWGLDFSPDGKYLATSSPANHEIHIWDWQTRRIVRTLEKVRHGFASGSASEPIRYSPDGRLLAVCHGRAQGNVVIRIWNTDTGAIVRDIDTSEDNGACEAIGFTPDGKSFVWISYRPTQNQLMVYSTATWQPVWGLRTVPFYPSTLAISSNGKLIAVGGSTGGPNIADQHQILIVDVAQRALVRTIQAYPTIKGGDGEIERLAWNPDSVHIAASARVTGTYAGPDTWPDAIRVFDARSGEKVTGEPAEYARVWALRYTPDGKYLIASGFKAGTKISSGRRHELLRIDPEPRAWKLAIRIWDGEHRQLLQEIPGEAGSAAVTRDGRYLALGGDGMIFILELK